MTNRLLRWVLFLPAAILAYRIMLSFLGFLAEISFLDTNYWTMFLIQAMSMWVSTLIGIAIAPNKRGIAATACALWAMLGATFYAFRFADTMGYAAAIGIIAGAGYGIYSALKLDAETTSR